MQRTSSTFDSPHPSAPLLLASVEMLEVRTDEEAVAAAFPGSPTIRVDGRDIDPTGATAAPSLTCRIYHRPGGRVSPLPTRQQIEEALT